MNLSKSFLDSNSKSQIIFICLDLDFSLSKLFFTIISSVVKFNLFSIFCL